MYRLAHRVPGCPVIAGAGAGLVHVEVFGVVDVAVWGGLNRIDDPGFEIKEDCSGDVAGVV